MHHKATLSIGRNVDGKLIHRDIVLRFGRSDTPSFFLGAPAEYGKSESEGTVKVYDLSSGKLLKSKSGITADTVYGTVEVIKPVLMDHVAFVTQGPLAETQVFMYDTSSGNLVKPLSFSRTYLDCFVSIVQSMHLRLAMGNSRGEGLEES